jgi:hypothetical protein
MVKASKGSKAMKSVLISVTHMWGISFSALILSKAYEKQEDFSNWR